jgi:SOS-response transcriptional repressor LexA
MYTTEFGQTILRLAKERKMTLMALAEAADISRHYLSYLIHGQRDNPTIDVVSRIAAALAVPLETFDMALPNDRKFSPVRKVPLISWVRAGTWHEPSDPYVPGQAEEWLYADADDPGVFALRVEGDSMEPEFYDGDIIVVNPAVEPTSGEYVVAAVNGEASFKQIFIYLNKVVLKALNPKYAPLEILRSDGRELVIKGKVIQKIKKY